MSISILIVLFYLLLTCLISLFSAGKTRSSQEFHGSQLSAAAILFASAGEWLGGTATSGVSEYGFTYGISGAWYTIANGLGVLFLALFFAKLYRSLNTGTIPGIISRYFGKQARQVSCAVLVFVMLVVELSQMIAAGKLGQALLGIDYEISVTLLAAAFLLFTLCGGMRSIAAANRLHLLVMYGGMILALILCVRQLGGPSLFLSSARQVDPELLNPTAIGGSKISSWVLASLLGACTAQAGIQPVLAAKDEGTAKRACLYTALVVAPFGIFTALLGVCARLLSAQGLLLTSEGLPLTDAKLALPTLVLHLPTLAGGLILASILAAILSTASPILLSAGTMLTNDLYALRHPDATPRKLLRVSRVMIALSGLICWLGALFLERRTMVLDIVYAAYSLRGALFVVLLMGIFGRRCNGRSASISMLVTTLVAILWTLVKVLTGNYPFFPWFTETYAAILTALITMLLLPGRSPLIEQNRS